MFQDLYNIAREVYHVDPAIFVFLYVITIPVYYLGLFLAVEAGVKFYRAKKKIKQSLKFTELLSEKTFLLGFIIIIIGWIIPYIYVAFWGANLPIVLFLLIGSFFILSIMLIIKKTNKKIINRQFVYKLANPEEAIAARELVHNRYTEVGYIKDSTNKGIFTDKYVKDSLYLIAKEDEAVVGVIRLVRDKGKGFPVFNEFSTESSELKQVRNIDRNKIVEIGNLAAIPGNHIGRGLYKEAIRYSVNNDIKFWIAAIDEGLFKHLQKKYWILRFFYKKIGNSKYYVGSNSVPIIIKPRKFMLLFL